MKEVVIFQTPTNLRPGQIWGISRGPVQWTKLLLASGLLSLLLLLSPFLLMEIEMGLSRVGGEERSLPTLVLAESGFAKAQGRSDLALLSPTNKEFSLIIPKIGVNSLVTAGVPLSNEPLYKSAMKQGVVHPAGSLFPGEKGRIFIFGHSTDYIWNMSRFNAVFYLLKELNQGDQVNLFYQGRCFVYQVTERKIAAADDLSLMQPQRLGEEVVLQTCWPPGTTWKRLLIIAKPV